MARVASQTGDYGLSIRISIFITIPLNILIAKYSAP